MEDGELTYRLLKLHNYSLIEMDDLELFHINDDGSKLNNPFRTKKALDMLNFIDNAIYFYKKYEDEEIMETFNTIPDFNTFINSGFDLSETVISEEKQSISNLEKQRKLYNEYLLKRRNDGS